MSLFLCLEKAVMRTAAIAFALLYQVCILVGGSHTPVG